MIAPADRLLVLGSRGAMYAQERGWRPIWCAPMASRAEGAPETARTLVAELYRRIAHGEIGRIDVVYARHGQGSAPQVERQSLIPLDVASFPGKERRLPPLHNMSPAALLEKLIAEYVLALLTEAAVESIASENAARLSAMESAHENVTKKMEQLRQSAQQARQGDITAELLDIVAGAEALEGGRNV